MLDIATISGLAALGVVLLIVAAIAVYALVTVYFGRAKEPNAAATKGSAFVSSAAKHIYDVVPPLSEKEGEEGEDVSASPQRRPRRLDPEIFGRLPNLKEQHYQSLAEVRRAHQDRMHTLPKPPVIYEKLPTADKPIHKITDVQSELANLLQTRGEDMSQWMNKQEQRQ
jgi:hypothetical protein